jgi:hypothetical protein
MTMMSEGAKRYFGISFSRTKGWLCRQSRRDRWIDMCGDPTIPVGSIRAFKTSRKGSTHKPIFHSPIAPKC